MNIRFFELARKMSLKSNHHHKLGSVLVRKNKPLGFGFNTIKTHSKSQHPFKSIHAEFSAILNSQLEDFKGCSIYIYRETLNGKIAPSFPCKWCQDMLRSLGIKEVYFTDYNGYQKKVI